jgi:hypothetical protein
VLAAALPIAELPALGDGAAPALGDCELPWLGEPLTEAVAAAIEVAVAVGDALEPAAEVAVALSLGVAELGGVAVSLGVAVSVGVVLLGVLLGGGVVATLPLPVGEGLLVGVGVGEGLFVIFVGVGVGLGCRGNCTHCWLPPAAARTRAEGPVPAREMLDWAADAAATESPTAVAMRTPPVTRLTPAGRTCAKRMKCPCQCCSLLLRTTYSVWSGHIRLKRPARTVRPPLHTKLGAWRHYHHYPPGSGP